MDDSLQRIAAAVAPAVMVSACGTLALGLDNQLARMSLRMRDMLKEWRAAPAAADPRRREVLLRQVEILGRRHARLSIAIFLAYTALFAFVLTSLLFLAQKIAAAPTALPIAVFAFGVLSLAGVALLAISSVRLSRAAIRLEMQDTGAA